MTTDLLRIAGQQSARYRANASEMDLEDLEQEGIAEMLAVIATKDLPHNPPAYLAGVCKRAMAGWWRAYRSIDITVFDENLHSAEEESAPEADMDRKEALKRIRKVVRA